MALGERGPNYGDRFAFAVFIAGNGGVPADARALARMHLREIGQQIGTVLDAKDTTIDDTTRAHLEECRHRIGKVLEASLNANEQ
jgi:hypothetical protein